MKRIGNLFDAVCSWENLELAARKTRKRKRYKACAEDFELHRETILGALREKLLDGSWRPDPYRTFTIHDPKERLICAPSYGDRIVHHALCNIVAPVIERTFVDQSHSCRIGMGTGSARATCRRCVRRFRYALKLDVAKYFPSIDHSILKGKIRRLIKCAPTLALVDTVIDSWHDTEGSIAWFCDDDLLTPLDRRRGVPIGALRGQLFANLYLTRMDHVVIEQLRPAGYVRYTDDLLLFSDSKAFLHEARIRLLEEMARERLKPHPTKCRVHACWEGIPFLGFRYWPGTVRVLRENRMRFEKRMRRFQFRMHADRAVLGKIWPSMFGWFQFVREYGVNEGLVLAECRRHAF